MFIETIAQRPGFDNNGSVILILSEKFQIVVKLFTKWKDCRTNAQLC